MSEILTHFNSSTSAAAASGILIDLTHSQCAFVQALSGLPSGVLLG